MKSSGPKEKFNHWLPKLLGVTAITIYPYIFYRQNYVDVRRSLQAHEMTHIKQVEAIGWIRFYLSYELYLLAGWVQHKSFWAGYRAIPYEVEARQVERDTDQTTLGHDRT